ADMNLTCRESVLRGRRGAAVDRPGLRGRAPAPRGRATRRPDGRCLALGGQARGGAREPSGSGDVAAVRPSAVAGEGGGTGSTRSAVRAVPAVVSAPCPSSRQ